MDKFFKNIKSWNVVVIPNKEEDADLSGLKSLTVDGIRVNPILIRDIEKEKDSIRDIPVSVIIIQSNGSNIEERLRFIDYVRNVLEKKITVIRLNLTSLLLSKRSDVMDYINSHHLNVDSTMVQPQDEQFFYLISSSIQTYKRLFVLNANIFILERLSSDSYNTLVFTSKKHLFRYNVRKLKEISNYFHIHIDIIIYIENELFYPANIEDTFKVDGENFLKRFNYSFKDRIKWIEDNSLIVLFSKDERTFAYIHFQEHPFPGLKEIMLNLSNELLTMYENIEISIDANSTIVETLSTLTELIENHSEVQSTHARGVMLYTEIISEAMGFDERTVDLYKMASMMHDIGKIGIPDAILNKPGKLTKEEFEIIKQHPPMGHRILSKFHKPLFDIASNIALYHHENWDGTGYPKGLKGNDIPIEARIVAIVDVYDAMISDKVYRKALPEDEALSFINKMSGIKFDPKIVDAFFNNYNRISTKREKLIYKNITYQ